MYSAPIYQHSTRVTDFLLIRTKSGYFFKLFKTKTIFIDTKSINKNYF